MSTTPDPKAAPPLDIERIIRRAKLRNAREPAAAIMALLFQRLHRHDPTTKLHMRIIVDEGRSTMEQVFALQYRDQLWSLHGLGDWDHIVARTLARTSQTWKNPKLVNVQEDVAADLERSLLATAFPLSAKLAQRIEEAVSFEEGQALARVAPSTEARRSGPRL